MERLSKGSFSIPGVGASSKGGDVSVISGRPGMVGIFSSVGESLASSGIGSSPKGEDVSVISGRLGMVGVFSGIGESLVETREADRSE